ncbi:MAG: hypothetical protein LBC86_06320 [Oscillospiraceae bacterium]|nr:hypothetical protein [Oscillospiraceae bacterium]
MFHTNNKNMKAVHMCNEHTPNGGENAEVIEEIRSNNDNGIIAVANSEYNIHILTIIGQVVNIDSE